MTFPNPLGGGTPADHGTGYLANYMPSIWAKKTLDFVESNLTCWKCIDTSWGKEFDGAKGDTLVINPLLEVNATAVNTFADPTDYNTDQGTPVNLIINLWYQSLVGVDDFQTLLGQPNYEDRVVPKLGYAIAKQIDTNVAALFNTFTQTAGTEGVTVDFDTLLDAKRQLDLVDAPSDNRYLIIDPETLQDLMQDDRFTSTLYQAGDAIGKGWIGQNKVLGCTVYMTTNLEAINTNYHGATMMHREAIAGVMKKNISYTTWREERRFTTFHRASAIYGLIVVRNTFGVWLRTRS